MNFLGVTSVRAGDIFFIFTKTSFVLGFKRVESHTSGEIFLFFPLGNIHASGIFFFKGDYFHLEYREKQRIQVP